LRPKPKLLLMRSAARHVAPFGDFVQQAVEVFQDRHGVRVDTLAVLADDHAPRGAVEQAHAQPAPVCRSAC
jgi:hypothetical protein